MEVEDNSGLEEGEAFYSRDDDHNIDPDIALSYIDEKLQNVLGHFQKDFEGGVSAENLGAKFGGYGSFLPTYERSPSILSHPKTVEKNYTTPRSPNNLPLEGASQNLKAPPHAAPTGRNGNTSQSVSAGQDSHLSFTQATDKSSLKGETLNTSKITAEQNLLKFRIKVPDVKSKKAAIYSGLGLDDSPSSSLRNSPEESGAIPSTDQETMSESPSSILQVMISSQVPGGQLVSPLHESLLFLCKREKERPYRDGKHMLSLDNSQEHSACLLNKPVLTKGKPLTAKKAKFNEKSEKLVEQKYKYGINVVDDKILLVNKKSENVRGKVVLANDLNVAGPVESTSTTSEVTMESNNDGIRDRLFCSNLAKPDSLESITGEDGGRTKKWKFQSCSGEKGLERSVENLNKDVPLDLGDNSRSRDNKTSAPSKCKKDQRKKVSMKAAFHIQDEINLPFEKEKALSESNGKSKGNQSTGKAAVSMKDNITISHGVFLSKSKMHKLKLKKDINKVRNNNNRDSLATNYEQIQQKCDIMDPLERQFGSRPKDAVLVDFDREQSTYTKNQKEMFRGTLVDNNLFGASAKHAPSVPPCVAENALASEGAPPAVAPPIVNEYWVGCDRCQKWRLLPYGRKADQLPEKWLCSMLDWLPGMNNCDVSEDETTQAVNAYNQILFSESQNNVQNNGNGTLSLHATAYLQDQGLNNSGFTSQSLRGKREHDLKEIAKAGGIRGLTQMSNSTKSQLSRNLSGMTQLHVESNVMKKSSFRQKEKHAVEGKSKQIKMKLKTKREPDHHAFEGSKKNKNEDMYSADKQQNSDSNLLRLCLNSAALPPQANGKGRQKYNECSNSEDVKGEVKERSVASVKKLANQTQASATGFDARMLNRTDNMGKKRKLKDWQESQNGHGLHVEEENSDIGSRKEKKSLVSKNEVKHSHRNDANDLSNRIARDNSVDGAEEVRSISKAHQISKHRRKNASQKTLDGLASSRRRSGQVSMAAASSLSKVSGSYGSRANFEALKGSPVESVSSSPLRIPYLEKLTSAGNTSLRDDTVDGDVHGRGNGRRNWDGEGTGNLSQPGMEKEEKLSHKVSKLDCWDGDANHTIVIKSMPYSGFENGNLTNDDIYATENVPSLRDQHATEHSHHEDGINKIYYDNELFPQGSHRDSASQSKANERSSVSDKMAYDMVNEHEDLHPRKSTRYGLETVPKGQPHLPGAVGENKCNMVNNNSGTKSSKALKSNKVGVKNSLGWLSGDCRIENQSREKEHDELDVKSVATCSTDQKIFPQQNLVQDFGGESKVTQLDSRSLVPKSFTRCEIETKQETEDHQILLEAYQGVVVDGFPGNSESPKVLLKQPANAGTASQAHHHNMEQGLANLHVMRSISMPSPGRMNPSGQSQTATDALKEAKNLKDYAELLKTSSYGFESNEVFFQAALKFLHGASLLGSSIGESGTHWEINQMQAYSAAARLWESCGQEYEKRKEMAAAALAYKCMEVAYMRIVFCKHSASNRDRNELQATVSMVPQGESPSSSVSDVDNLNNQAVAEKATLSKCTVSHVSGTYIVVPRNRPSFVRLLDFTQDVNFAMEASTKSHNAFEAAKLILEDAQKVDCVTSVRKAIDFSFQDVDGLICLVELAKEAIRRCGLRWC